MRNDQSVRRQQRSARAIYPGLWLGFRPCRAQGHGHGAGRPGSARKRVPGRYRVAGTARGVRADALRQRRGGGLCLAPEAAALRRLPVGTGSDPQTAARPGRRCPIGQGKNSMNSLYQDAQAGQGYNFAYLDEQTKRSLRRGLLKAVAIPGYQVPFGGREMPLPYGWGTGGMQVTAAILGEGDVLKVIDQGADDTTNAGSIRRFFVRTAGVQPNERKTGV